MTNALSQSPTCTTPPNVLVESRFSRMLWIVGLAVSFVLISLLAVSHESFWIDEFTTTHFASQPSLRAMWHEMLKLRWPELQAPFYMAYMWCWQHLFGTGEWTSRVAGVPWFVTGATAFVMAWSSRSERVCAALVVACSPFAWFYLNEARLYSIELGLAYFLIAALVQLWHDHFHSQNVEFRSLSLVCLGLCLLCALTVLGMIWSTAVLVLLPLVFPLGLLLRWARRYWILIGATALVLFLCAIYYLWTRSLGTRAASIGGTDWKTLGFVFYEELGFNGLGPGRLALREVGIQSLVPWLPWLAVYGLALGSVFIAAALEIIRKRQMAIALSVAAALVVPAAVLLAIGFLMKFRLLGRHCTPMVAVIALVLTIGTSKLWSSNQWWARILLAVYLPISLLSCVSQRFAQRHAKDDYRSAIHIAKLALGRGQSVWWNAELFACRYYHLDASSDLPVTGKAWVLMCPSLGFQQGKPKPDIVIVSKPDVYDAHAAVRNFLTEGRYVPRQTLPGFVVFEAP